MVTNWWDDPKYGTAPVQQVPLSRIDEFKKQQVDQTKVGKVEQAIMPKVAGAIEAGKGIPLLGRLINPAMELMEGIGKYVIQPVTQGVSTALLTPQAMLAGKGNPIQSFRYAKEQAKKISMGQALATTVGQGFSFLPDQLTPTFMDSDFNIFDDKQRDKAFRDEWAGILASGTTDLALAALGSKGAGIGVRAAAKKVAGPKKLVTAEDVNKFKSELNQIVSEQALPVEQRTRTGLSVLVDDLVNEKDLSKLSSNPLVSETANPYRTATIVSRLDTHQDVADYLLAERGDTAAFLRFFERNPLKADHLDNYGLELTRPISNFENIAIENLTPKLTERYQRIIDAKKSTDKNFAMALDDFLRSSKDSTFESYRPGRFAVLEQMSLAKKKIANQAQFGDLKLFGADGNSPWKVKVYQSEPYDRVVRFIAWTGSGRPQGHINLSNPRRFEAANDLRSDLNRVLFLKGAEGAQFKRDMVNKFLGAQSDTQRAIALTQIEEEILKRLATRYGVTELMDVRTMDDAIKRMKSWHSRLSNNRQTLKSYAAKNGIIPDEDGNINIQNFISVSNEAQTLPMLDFAKLERDMIQHLGGTRQGIVKPADIRRAKWAQRGTTLGEFLDLANMAFSNMNLIRVAYIPKNSMVDPIARASMALESTEIVRNSLPGMSNFLYNGSLRFERSKKFIPFSPKWNERKMMKQTKFNMDKFIADMQPKVTAKEVAEQAAYDADILLKQATARRDRLKKRAEKSNDPDVLATYHEAEDAYWQAVNNYTKANNEFNKLSDEVYGYAKLIDIERQKLQPYQFNQSELRAKTKTLGQEEEIITSASGKKYTIAGLADPNQRGVSAYMSEIDSSQNFYSASMQSEMGRRVKYDGSKFVKIKRSDGKEYWNALAHIANRQIRNEIDLPLGRIMRGDSDADILKWFNTEGKEFANRIMERGVYNDLQSYISDTRERLFSMFPDEQVRQTILSRNVHWKELEASMAGRLDLAESIDGPSIKLSDLSTAEKKLAGASGFIDSLWKVLAYSENRMARNPLFLSYTRDELKTLINAAERAGVNPRDVVVNNRMRQIAYRNALARVERTLYSSRRLTNGMYLLRYGMSFPLAFFNSQAVALRLMAKNPMNAYWYANIAEAMDEFQAYEDQDGNTYKSIKDVPKGTSVSVKFPLHDKLPGWAKGALKPYTDARGGGVRLNPKQMEFMVADPSVSWFGSVTISELIKDGFGIGPWKVYGEDLAKSLRNTLGDDVFESSVLYGGYPTQGGGFVDTALNTIFPGYGKSAADAVQLLFGKDGSDRAADEILTQYKTAYAEWDRNGRVGNPPTPRQAAKAAGWMMFIRAVVQFNAPISVSFDPVTRAATAYYADLVDENKGDYDAAQKQMIKDWGIDSLALIGSNQRNVAGFAATQNDIKIIRNFGGLLETIGRTGAKYAGMLSSGYDSDLTSNSEYSTEIAAIYKRLDFPGEVDLPITSRKTVADVRKETEARRGWAEYQKAQEWRDAMMYQYGIPSTQSAMYERSGIKEYFQGMVSGIVKDFPGWAEQYDNNREDYWNNLIPTVEKIANDTKWRTYAYKSGDKWEEISFWLTQAKYFKSLYNETANTEDRKLRLKTEFAQFHYDYLQTASDEFASFAYRWLNNMPELNEELVVRR